MFRQNNVVTVFLFVDNCIPADRQSPVSKRQLQKPLHVFLAEHLGDRALPFSFAREQIMTVEFVCQGCGKHMQVYPSQAKRSKYCSRSCAAASRTLLSNGYRTCTKCGESLPATTEHFREIATKVGLSSVCRTCLSERQKEYNERRYERMREYNSEYRKSHPEWTRKVKHESYMRNRESAIAKSKAWRLANPDKTKLTPERSKIKDERKRLRKQGMIGSHTKQDLAIIFDKQEGKCFYCACELTDWHVDHYIPVSRGGTNWPDNIVLACPQCNLAKGNMMPDVFVQEHLPLSLKLREAQP